MRTRPALSGRESQPSRQVRGGASARRSQSDHSSGSSGASRTVSLVRLFLIVGIAPSRKVAKVSPIRVVDSATTATTSTPPEAIDQRPGEQLADRWDGCRDRTLVRIYRIPRTLNSKPWQPAPARVDITKLIATFGANMRDRFRVWQATGLVGPAARRPRLWAVG